MRFESLTTDDGLPTNQIFALCQDNKGFLWIGTANGLVRYDGYDFKKYTHNQANKKSLSNNYVYTIFEDSFGYLWIGTAGGLNKFNSATQSFTHYTHNSSDQHSISYNIISAIYEDKDRNLWIGTNGGGLNKYDRERQQFIRYQKTSDVTNCLSSNNITSIYGDNSGNLWIGLYGNGIDKYEKASKKFTNYRSSVTDVNSLSSNLVLCVYVDSNDDLWVGTEDKGLNKYNYESNSFIRFLRKPDDPLGLNSSIVFSVIEYNKNNLLIGTGNGLNIFDKEKNQIIKYNYNRYEPEKIFGFSRVIIKDNVGLIWVGTDAQGIKKINPQLNFYHFRNIPDNFENLPHQNVMSICEENDSTIWFGEGGGGLILFNFITEEYAQFTVDLNNKNSISSTAILAVYKDRFGILWIGTIGGGLNRLVPNKKDLSLSSFIIYKNNPDDPKSLSDNNVGSIFEDSYGELWVGTYGGGLNKVINKDGNRNLISFYHYKANPNDTSSITSNHITFIYEDRSRELWIGTSEGLNRYIRDKDNFVRYLNKDENLESFASNYIVSAYEDESNNLWIGTNAGLSKFNRSNGLCRNYSKKDGLPDEMIYRIEEDNKGNLWLSTNYGLSKFNPRTESFKNFNVQDGLQGNEFDTGASFKNKKGQIFFGGMTGLNVFHPDSIRENNHIPNMVITDFQLNNISVSVGLDTIFNRTILNNAIVEATEIELYHYDKVISFEFAALDFQIPKKNKYAYMLEGFDKNWHSTDANRRFVTYTNLDPGDYVFRVKGSNNDGHWNEAGASVRLIILPPWWATTWAYFIYALIIISIVYFTWRLQLKRIRIKHDYEMSKFEAEKLHEVDELKSRFFTNISHEFRTPLTLILGPVKQIVEKLSDGKMKDELSIVHKNANKLLGLVNQLMDISKLESGNMKLRTSLVNFISLVKALTLSFTSYAERKRIILKFNSTENEVIIYIDKDKIEKIITNILSNAFKFTPEGGRIEVTLAKDDKYVNTIISDTGIGIPKAKMSKIFDRFYQVDGSHTREQEGTGIGLALTKELVELHKGKIEVESEESKGTTFTVRIPLGKEHLKTEEIIEKDQEYENEAIKVEFDENIEKKVKQKMDVELLENESLPLLLIVEDNSDVRNYIKDNLKKDYRILEAVDGEDGWNKSVEQIPDLIVSDVMMPKMDGFKLCEKLKTDERTSHIPVILLTAKAAKEDKLEGYETGADDYIMKPFEPDELRARIKNLIEQRKRLHEHFQKKGMFELNHTEITSIDKKFLNKAFELLHQNISDTSFNVEAFGEKMGMSRSVLYKKIVALTGEPPVEFIRRIRLNYAMKLIEKKFGNLSEVALEAGFNNPAYFSECFKKQFGITPSQYQQKITNR